jgi:hypothetical protein
MLLVVISNFLCFLCCYNVIEGNAKKIASFLVGAPLFHHRFISHFLCFAQLVLTMPVQPDDPRLYIGASVETKAVVVTSFAECSRRYGTNAKTKVVPGLVVSFGHDSAPPGRTRAITFIVADFYFGDNVVK